MFVLITANDMTNKILSMPIYFNKKIISHASSVQIIKKLKNCSSNSLYL